MREILFKNLTSVNRRKKDIVLKEVFEKDGVHARTERRCFYFIKAVAHLDENKDLQGWINSHGNAAKVNKRHFHIMKEHNDKMGEDKVICKIGGTFYAIINKSIYTIAFLHSFKACFIKATLT